MTVETETLDLINFILAIAGIILAVLASFWGILVQHRSEDLNRNTQITLTRVEEHSNKTEQYVDQISRETTRSLFRLVEKGVLPDSAASSGLISSDSPAEVLKDRSHYVRRLIIKLVQAAPPSTVDGGELTPLFQSDSLTPEDHQFLLTLIEEHNLQNTSSSRKE